MANWKVCGASIAGRSHAAGGVGCQDAHGWRVLPGLGVLLAVSDGAGSAAFAAQASRAAVDAALEAMERAASDGRAHEACAGVVEMGLKAAMEVLRCMAEEVRAPLRDYSATLILVAALGGALSAVQVGDGAAVTSSPPGGIAAITLPEQGEYANETLFITSAGALERAQPVCVRPWPAHVAVLTDGLQRLALRLPSGEPHSPFFAPLFEFMEREFPEQGCSGEIERFLRSRRVAERCDDDVTLVLASRT